MTTTKYTTGEIAFTLVVCAVLAIIIIRPRDLSALQPQPLPP